MKFSPCLCASVVILCLGASTQPSRQRFALMNGAVKYMVPGEWKETRRTPTDRDAQYESVDGKVKVVVGVIPQEYGFPKNNDHAVELLKTGLIKMMKKAFEDRGDQIVYGPRSESDDRFVVRIHAKIVREGKPYDEVHVYRALGLDLLTTLTETQSNDEKEIKAAHELGEDVCLSIILAPADKKKPPVKAK